MTNIASVTESAIYIAPNGNYSGEYVVGCASDRCGYLSKSVLCINYGSPDGLTAFKKFA